MKKRIVTSGISVLLCMAMVSVVGCGDGDNAAPRDGGTHAHVARPGRPQAEAVSLTRNTALPIVVSGGRKYVRADDLVRVLEYNSQWDADTKTLRIGDYDASFAFQAGSPVAVREGSRIRLPMAAIMANGSLLLPVCAIDELFRQDLTFDVTDTQVVVHANNGTAGTMSVRDTDDANDVPEEFRFADYPYDYGRGTTRGPANGTGAPTGSANGAGAPSDAANGNGGPTSAGNDTGAPSDAENGTGAPTGPAADTGTPTGTGNGSTAGTARTTRTGSRVDIAGLIQRAKQYIGVPYRFGAGPFPQSGRFDCSSYTQYVFGRSGLQLPRSSRQQATVGTYVGRQQLQAGDLLFFNTPARFRSRTTVGHVGIYIGNGQMINANPSRGVQILDINRGYWSRTYLFARRAI